MNTSSTPEQHSPSSTPSKRKRRTSIRSRSSSPPTADNRNNISQGAEIVKTSLRGYFKRAQQLLHVKRFHEALTVLSKGANLQPSDSAFVLLNVLRADAYAGLLDFGSAIASLRSAVLCSKYDEEQNSLRCRLAYLLDTAGIACLQKNQPERAYEFIGEAADLDGGNSLEILLHRCFCLIALQRLDDATNELAGLRFVAETCMNEPIALECVVLSISLGIVQRRFEDAKHFLDLTSKKIDPSEETSSIGGFGGGGADNNNNDGKASWADHPRILELEREFDTAFSNFIREAKAAGDIQALSVGIRCFPNDPELYRARAEALVEKGLFAQGIQDYFKTIEKSSGRDEAAERSVSRTLFSVAKQLVFAPENDESLARERENLTSAVTYLSEAHRWDPEDVEVIVMRGDCLFQLREHEACLGDFQRAQSLEPDNVDIRHRISDLHNMWASHLFEQKNYAGAEREFTKAIEISPFEPRYFFFRAQCRLLSAKSPEDHMLGVRDLIECRNLGVSAQEHPDIVMMVNQLCPDDRIQNNANDDDNYGREVQAKMKNAKILKLFGGNNNNSNEKQQDRQQQRRTSPFFGSNNYRRPLIIQRRRRRGNEHDDGEDDNDEGNDNKEVNVLRGNRGELLSSPIDSKKLREATASLLMNAANSNDKTNSHDGCDNQMATTTNNNNNNNNNKIMIHPSQKSLQELAGARQVTSSVVSKGSMQQQQNQNQVTINGDTKNQQRKTVNVNSNNKEPFWLKNGEVTTLSVKNRLTRHDFIGSKSATTKKTSQSSPLTKATSPKPTTARTTTTTTTNPTETPPQSKMSSKGRLLQQLLLEKEQQLQGQGQIQHRMEQSLFLRSMHHPQQQQQHHHQNHQNHQNQQHNQNQQQNRIGNSNTTKPPSAEQKFSVSTSAHEATKRRETVKYQQEARVRLLPPIAGVNVL